MQLISGIAPICRQADYKIEPSDTEKKQTNLRNPFRIHAVQF